MGYVLPDFRQQNGQICEAILTEWLLRRGFYVCRPIAAQGPVDVIAYNDEGDVFFFDSKQDAARVNPGRGKSERIYRAKTPAQKLLNVRTAYVDINTREVTIVPPIGGEEE